MGRAMKLSRGLPPLLALPWLLSGCVSDPEGAAGVVTIHATVEAYDPDGLLFDLMVSTRAFDPGTATRGPLSQVTVQSPARLAGRKYLIALPDERVAAPRTPGARLRERGAEVTFDLPAALVGRAAHEIIELTDLRWPAPVP